MSPAVDASGDAVYTHRGTAAIQRLVEYAPATGGLALWIRHADDDDLAVRGLEAATDGTAIRYGPAFEQLTLARQTGMVAHQVLHVALRHAQRADDLRQTLGDVDAELYNVCADAIVNSALGHLSWLEIPKGGVRLETLLSRVMGIDEPVEKSLLEWDVERLYRAIDDRDGRGRQQQAAQRGGGGEAQASSAEATGEGGGVSSSGPPRPVRPQGAHVRRRSDGPRAQSARALAGGTARDLLPAQGEGPEAEAQASREWRERLSRAHARDGGHSLLRELLQDLPLPRTPWQALLRSWLSRGLMAAPTLSWSRPARSWIANQGRDPRGRRIPFEPGTSSMRAVPRLAVMVDVSGSIDDALLERFAREISAIARRCEAQITLVLGDDRVRSITTLGTGERLKPAALRVQGGGGTDFTPLLEAAERGGADMGVLLTDLDGPANHRPAFPVIWATPASAADFPTPFGRRLLLD